MHSVSSVRVCVLVLARCNDIPANADTRWPPSGQMRVLHSTAVRWKSYFYMWWIFVCVCVFSGQMKDFMAPLLPETMPDLSELKNKTKKTTTSRPCWIKSKLHCHWDECIAVFAPSVRCQVFTSQQVYFCLCKCNTIWGTLTNRAAQMDKQHAGYLK